jgi:hypothetical protein
MNRCQETQHGITETLTPNSIRNFGEADKGGRPERFRVNRSKKSVTSHA